MNPLLDFLDLGDYLYQVEQIVLDYIDQHEDKLPFLKCCKLLEEEKTPVAASGEVRPTLIQKDFVSPATLICKLLKEFEMIIPEDERE